MKKLTGIFAVALVLCSLLSMSVGAITNETGLVSVDSDTGVKIYRDATGGIVVSGIGDSEYINTHSNVVRDVATNEPSAMSDDLYIDYEYNPIYIGTWSNTDCYARHTLGNYNDTLHYLTSYGYVSWYNTDGNTAVPYRNGAANNNSGQETVDVAKFSYFDIRDLGTNNATTLQITDWGPNQNSYPDRIADLDKTDFYELHGNNQDGIFYARTWVPIENYNP